MAKRRKRFAIEIDFKFSSCARIDFEVMLLRQEKYTRQNGQLESGRRNPYIDVEICSRFK